MVAKVHRAGTLAAVSAMERRSAAEHPQKQSGADEAPDEPAPGHIVRAVCLCVLPTVFFPVQPSFKTPLIICSNLPQLSLPCPYCYMHYAFLNRTETIERVLLTYPTVPHNIPFYIGFIRGLYVPKP